MFDGADKSAASELSCRLNPVRIKKHATFVAIGDICWMRRILILDDEPLVAMMMEDWLAELGFEPVGPVSSVASALRATDEGNIDGAILDVSLGAGGNCYEVAEVLQQRSIPFAFATGRGAEDLDARFRGIAVLTKPFDFDAVKILLGNLFT